MIKKLKIILTSSLMLLGVTAANAEVKCKSAFCGGKIGLGLGVDVSGFSKNNTDKNKTFVHASLSAGWDHVIDNTGLLIGFSTGFGLSFLKNTFEYQTTPGNKVTQTNNGQIFIKPRIGFVIKDAVAVGFIPGFCVSFDNFKIEGAGLGTTNFNPTKYSFMPGMFIEAKTSFGSLGLEYNLLKGYENENENEDERLKKFNSHKVMLYVNYSF